MPNDQKSNLNFLPINMVKRIFKTESFQVLLTYFHKIDGTRPNRKQWQNADTFGLSLF